jgi:hypothetical protein
MVNLRTRYAPWVGAGAGAVIADVAEVKLHPLSQRLTNRELTAAALVLADAFGFGGRYTEQLHGASDWAVGELVSAIVQPHLTPPVVVPTTVAKTATTTTTAGRGVTVSGLSGSPAYA